MVGGWGCQGGLGHSPDFKALPRGLVVPPPTLSVLLPRGWQMLFHRLRRVGGLRKVLLGGSGGSGGVGSCLPARAGSQWPPRSLNPPGLGAGVVLRN